MRKYLSIKFMLPSCVVVVLGTSVFGWVMSHTLASEIRNRANREADEQVEAVLNTLQTVDGLSSQSVQAAMRVLHREAEQFGAPEIKGTATVAGSTLPELQLGHTSQDGNFGLVDRIRELTGSTATLFVKNGDSFIRVSTNVLKQDGSRAIGTPLDPSGQAIAAIREGRSFYGVIDILGSPYMAGYEPMRNQASKVVGIWYVGYPLTAVADLGKRISTAKILDSGYLALLHANGKVIFKPDHVSAEEIGQRLDHAEATQWTVLSKPFDKWGYMLLAAYPSADIAARVRRTEVIIVCSMLLLSISVVVGQYLLITKLVLQPVKQLSQMIQNIAEGEGDVTRRLEAAEGFADDELGDVSRFFNLFMDKLQEILRGVSAHTRKLRTASQQLLAASEQITANSSETAVQSNSVSHITQQVSQNLQSLSTGAGEMTSTIQSIAVNANEAAQVAASAVGAAQAADTTVTKLGHSSAEIGVGRQGHHLHRATDKPARPECNH